MLGDAADAGRPADLAFVLMQIGTEELARLVADLTHERPNCYLEVGYALGIGRFTTLVLMAREDHHPDHPSHRPLGPKVHFDLSGYDILFWSPHKLPGLRSELEKRVRRRQLLLREA